MGVVETPVEVDQWYCFVASEHSPWPKTTSPKRILLVMEPQFNLLAVLEDELLMALLLVPMRRGMPRRAKAPGG